MAKGIIRKAQADLARASKGQVGKPKKVKGGQTPQGQFVVETPESPSSGLPHSPLDAYGNWLGDPGLRYGRLLASTDIPPAVKLEMLRDPVIAWCQAFLTSALVRAQRVIECTDESKRRFFEDMFRAWESQFILQSSFALALGSVGLIKRLEFAIPQPVEFGAEPAWTGDTLPLICAGFDQVYPVGATPRFDETGKHFEGIDYAGGSVDQVYSLWVTLGQAKAFGSYLGAGRSENVYRAWWLKSFTADLYAVYLQKNIDRVIKVGYPPGKNKDGDDNRSTALQVGDMARSGATVAIPSTVYMVDDPMTGVEKPTGVQKWTLDVLEGAQTVGSFHEIDDHQNRAIALGYLVPPQAFLDVGGGQLGGPTSADVLARIAEHTLMMDAADLDRHINKYVFPFIDKANFPPDGPPVRVRTVGLEEDSRLALFEIVKGLLARADVDPSVFDLRGAMEELGLRVAKKSAGTATKPEAETKGAGQGGETPPEQPTGETAPEQAAGEVGAIAAAAGKTPDANLTAIVRSVAQAKVPTEKDDAQAAQIAQSDIEIALARIRQVLPEAFDAEPIEVGEGTPVGASSDDIEFGGAGSGNFGHAGRAGKLGGSSPNTSRRAAPRSKKPTTVPNWQGRPSSEPASISGGEGQARGMSEAVRAAIGNGVADCFAYTKKKGLEAAVLIDGEGKRIGMVKSKSKWEVDYSSIADGTQRIDIHSHPNRSSFSEQDVRSFALSIGSTDHSIVVGADGTIYTMSKPRGWSKTQAAGYNFKQSYSEKRQKFHNEARRQGILDQDDAFEFNTHKSIEGMCAELGLIYSRIPPAQPTGGA